MGILKKKKVDEDTTCNPIGIYGSTCCRENYKILQSSV